MVAMMGISFAAVAIVLALCALLALGGLAVLVTTVVLALAKNRPGIAAAVCGVALFGLLLAAGVLFAYFSMAPPAHAVSITTAGSPSFSASYTRSVPAVVRGVSMLRGILVLAIIAVVLTVLSRHSSGKAPVGRWWPVLLIPFVLLFLLSGVHVQTSNERSPKRIETAQRNIAQQRAATERRVAEIESRFKNTDIHKLMDKHDAPRIALAPPPPAAPEEPAAPTPSDGEAASAAVSHVAPQEPTANDEAAEPAAEADSASQSDAASEAPESSEAAPATASAEDEKNDGPGASQADESARSDEAEERGRGRAGSPDEEAVSAPRPAWVDDPPKRIGQVWREVIETDQYETVEECYRAADIYLQATTYDHLARLVGIRNYAAGVRPDLALYARTPDGGRVSALASVGVGIEYIRREIAKDEYVETTERSFGPMKKLYTLIEFSPAVDRELQARWAASRRQERFAVVGVGAASVLGLLGMVWGLLKIDTVTRGYYTKRLFLGVPAAIIGGIVLLTVVASLLGM